MNEDVMESRAKLLLGTVSAHAGLFAAVVPALVGVDYLAGLSFYRGHLRAFNLRGAITPDLYSVLAVGPLGLAIVGCTYAIVYSISRFLRPLATVLPQSWLAGVKGQIVVGSGTRAGRTIWLFYGATLVLYSLYVLPGFYAGVVASIERREVCEAECSELLTVKGRFRGEIVEADSERAALLTSSDEVVLLKWDDVLHIKKVRIEKKQANAQTRPNQAMPASTLPVRGTSKPVDGRASNP
ncbi:hypothetical protein [Novosphingobium jiangmenense]|uniref:NfeD-like C-terminal domain-containing protein n=1 Tax=Novosphingobium jiangmenense TaxID=2791981 RepID=A0ABS0HG87_9SPHN|nr:hypothetical protein [Novosphingobium jiangmenense]MBF9151257.1 hypothetical protein [Novosphingobium jiangmenense]